MPVSGCPPPYLWGTDPMAAVPSGKDRPPPPDAGQRAANFPKGQEDPAALSTTLRVEDGIGAVCSFNRAGHSQAEGQGLGRSGLT